jgi:hypothetical protein
MAVVWGRKATGKDGPMTETEVVDALYTNSGWRRSDAITKGFKNAANYMFAHNGQGGGTKYHFDGKIVRHATENHGEVTIFFTSDGNVASIVGIGEHSGPNKATATYTLVWQSARWNPTVLRPVRQDDGTTVQQSVSTKQISL